MTQDVFSRTDSEVTGNKGAIAFKVRKIRPLQCYNTDGSEYLKKAIYCFHIDDNAPCLPPPKFCITTVFLGITVVPREIEDSGYAKFWGGNKVHYSLSESGEQAE